MDSQKLPMHSYSTVLDDQFMTIHHIRSVTILSDTIGCDILVYCHRDYQIVLVLIGDLRKFLIASFSTVISQAVRKA